MRQAAFTNKCSFIPRALDGYHVNVNNNCLLRINRHGEIRTPTLKTLREAGKTLTVPISPGSQEMQP